MKLPFRLPFRMPTVLTASLLLSVVVGAGCAKNPVEEAPSLATSGTVGPLKVAAVRPVRKTLVRRVQQPGEVMAFEQTPILSKLGGHVGKVLVDIGDPICGPRRDAQGEVTEPGQVLVELDVPELHDIAKQRHAEVQLADARVRIAKSAVQVAEAKRSAAAALVKEAEAAVVGTRSTKQKWQLEKDRIEKLAQSGSITAKLVEEANSGFVTAQAEEQVALAKVDSCRSQAAAMDAESEKAKVDVVAAEAELSVRSGALREAESMVAYSTLRAPYDGVVTERLVHTGHLVAAGSSASSPLLVVARTDRLRLGVDVPESDAVHLQPGAEVSLRIPSLPASSRKVSVARIQWALRDESRTLRCEMDLENTDGQFRPGMYVTADIKVAEHPNALTIPKGAILVHEGQSVCLTVDAANKIVRLPIVTGLRAGLDVEVLSGLDETSRIVAGNVSSLREGQEVELTGP